MIFGKYLNRYYLRYIYMLILGILALVVVDYMQLAIPEYYRSLVNGLTYGVVTKDGATVEFDMEFLLSEICLPMIFVILGIVIGRFLWRIAFRSVAIKAETGLREEMFSRSLELSREYYNTNKVGDLMTLYTNDIETVQDCVSWGVLMFFDALFLGILAVRKMFLMDRVLTLLSLIPMGLLLGIGAVLDHHLEKRWDKRQAAFSELSDFAQQTFSGIAVVKAFVKETVELIRFKKINEKNENANVSHTKMSTVLSILVTLFVESVVCVILGYGGFLVWKGDFNAGQLVEFIGYFTAIIWPIMAVSQLIEMRSRGNASLKRIAKLLDSKADVCDSCSVEKSPELRASVEFRNLDFTYPGASYPALSGVSFKIEEGELVGLVGKTGSGKTTLVDLIVRTYNVEDGTLFIGGKDINKIPIRSVRDFVSYVPQDNFLFSDTIANNISFASDRKREDEIIAAAKSAEVHSNIAEFPDAYSTVLGERGVTVSGGQKQRISIARALIKDSGILILDDSVSAVDVKTEKRILENLRAVRKNKTTILIAHRVSTVEGMDKIIYIDDGVITGVGTHAELIERCASYRNMVELQRLDSKEADYE